MVRQTLRSRCVERKLPPAGRCAAAAPEWGEALCRALGAGKRGAAAELAVRMERKRVSREVLAEALAWAREALAEALLSCYGRPAEREIASFLAKTLTKAQMMSTIELLELYHGQCAYNVGPSHVLGALAAELEGIL